MTNLFVLGNGFDLAHDLKTSYNDFRKYLLSKHPELTIDILVTPRGVTQPDGDVHYDEREVLSLIFYLISQAEGDTTDWNDIETSLGMLDFTEAFDWHEPQLDKEGDVDWGKMSKMYEDIARELVIPTTAIQNLFAEWVQTIRTYEVEPKEEFEQLLSEDDLYLTFNYTDTLQMAYEVSEDSVCHIHGCQYEPIHFGHGNQVDRTDEYMGDFFGSQDHLFEIDEALRKKSEEAIADHADFFDDLRERTIRNIYSYGFSFNGVDEIYLKELCECIETKNVTWHFHDYNNEEHERFQTTLTRCGFKGAFSSFQVS